MKISSWAWKSESNQMVLTNVFHLWFYVLFWCATNGMIVSFYPKRSLKFPWFIQCIKQMIKKAFYANWISLVLHFSQHYVENFWGKIYLVLFMTVDVSLLHFIFETLFLNSPAPKREDFSMFIEMALDDDSSFYFSGLFHLILREKNVNFHYWIFCGLWGDFFKFI